MARRLTRRLLGRRARLRWVHLVLGGALLTPFHLAALTVLTGTGLSRDIPAEPLTSQLLALALALPFVALTGLVPLVRTLEGGAARVLCAPTGEVLSLPATSAAARRRAAAWFTLHALAGGVVAGVSLAAPPGGLVLLLLPLSANLADVFGWAEPATSLPLAWTPLGLALILLPLPVSAAAGAWLARIAPILLGPTPADRLALAEQRAERLAERARIARDLHDSVGHALSAVGIQAAAAGRLLDRDPAFVARALTAIEDTARDAVAELDHVLGLLREETPEPAAPVPSLANLAELVARTRAAGADVDLHLDPADGVAALPRLVSREAYRIVQEGFGNVLRHAGEVPVSLHLRLGRGELTIDLSNPIAGTRPTRSGGGRGLRGTAERVAVLRGTFTAGPRDGRWHLSARIPLEGHP
ncbi:sensor histidine kinase [Embleya hyalina]|uniref:histidine kinase n=1 Tax=Embleya hyalina TaxID=516124 RepID=A0A401Z0X9_9ACTN|nr:histidine kinase [Embleya hyalina]GCE00461.1 histidine kinase [Embleya hyalina]